MHCHLHHISRKMNPDLGHLSINIEDKLLNENENSSKIGFMSQFRSVRCNGSR
jgi:hypothetical protein